jgi:hypothetical protein
MVHVGGLALVPARPMRMPLAWHVGGRDDWNGDYVSL